MDEAAPKFGYPRHCVAYRPKTHRGKWPLGRIVEVFPGPDGIVKTVAVSVRTGRDTRTKITKKSVSKLCPLLTHQDVEDDSDRNRAGDEADKSPDGIEDRFKLPVVGP